MGFCNGAGWGVEGPVAEAPSADDVLAEVVDLEAKRDAQGLVGLESHPDKRVRKAVRRAIHKLRSKGVAIPKGTGRSWSTGDTLAQLRGSLESAAILDVESIPGAIRLALTEPDEQDGGVLYVAALAPDDRVLNFSAYGQSDGQRQRMLKDWGRTFDGRRVPAAWAKQRLRWAREATVGLGFEAPEALDASLPSLGDPVTARPATFLGDELSSIQSSGLSAKDLLQDVGALRWPVLFDATGLLNRLESLAEGFFAEGQNEAERLTALSNAAKGDVEIREALAGRLANLLDDTAIAVWLNGKAGDARALLDMASDLRSSDEPEALPWVAELLMIQLTAAAMSELQSRGGSLS